MFFEKAENRCLGKKNNLTFRMLSSLEKNLIFRVYVLTTDDEQLQFRFISELLKMRIYLNYELRISFSP